MQQACPSVSVLVPIYNVERYLPQCLEALCSQTLRDLDIVIVDKPNSGYGASMNCGIEAARGAYIGIVEPDDFPERDMFKRLLRMAQRHDCDLVKCNFFEHYEDHDDRIRNFADFPYGRLFDPVEQPRIVCTIPAICSASS